MTSIIEFSRGAPSGFALAARPDLRLETQARQAGAAPIGCGTDATTAALEGQLLARTADLRAANAALETFAFEVARELRTPLDTIEELRALLDRRAATLDPALLAQCERIHAASQRMRVMVCGLLDLSRGLSQAQREPAESPQTGSGPSAESLASPFRAPCMATKRQAGPITAELRASSGVEPAGRRDGVPLARGRRMLRELAPVSSGGLLVFAVSLALIGICAAII